MSERDTFTNPVSWGRFVQEVGIPGATIFALLSMLGYLALQGVPAILRFAQAIEDSTKAAAVRQESILRLEDEQQITERKVIENQSLIIENEQKMIDQHGQMIDLMQQKQDKPKK